MANLVFKGFKQVSNSFDDFENGYIYLVRSNSGATDGYIYFNGKKYGTAEDAATELSALIGTVPQGYNSLAEYIETVESALTAEASARALMDNAIIGDSAETSTTGANIYDLRRAVNAFSGSSHTHSNLDVLNGITAEKVAAWDAAEDNASAYTDSQIADAIAAETARTESTYAKTTDLDDYSTSADTESAIADAIAAETARTESTYAKTTDLDDYSTSADTESAVADAIAAETARTESTYAKTTDLDDYSTSADTESAVADAIAAETARTESTYAKTTDLDDYLTSGQTTGAIEDAIANETARTESAYVKTADLDDYMTSAETQSAITEAVSGKQDELVFKTAYDPTTNKVVTESDIKDLEGAMHFVGISSTDPVAEGATIPGVTAFTAGDVCLYGVKEYIYASDSQWHEIGDEGLYVTKSTTIAGVDLQDNISKNELLQALNVEDGAEENVLESIEVNGSALTISAKTASMTITSGSTDGSIAVNGTDVPVAGLGTAAYANAGDFEASGTSAAAIASAITELDATVSGTSSGTTVTVVEADGVLTGVQVQNHISSDSDNAIEMKSDGFFAAIYYEDLDSE